MICSICGNSIADWAHGTCYNCQRNQEEARRYGQQHERSGYTSFQRQTVLDVNRNDPVSTKDIKLQRAGINKLLADIYRRRRLLSEILAKGEISEDNIDHLKYKQISLYLGLLLNRLRTWLGDTMPAESVNALWQFYNLRGEPDNVRNLSSDTITLHTNNALAQLRSDGARAELEQLIVETAQKVLAQQND